MAIFRLPFTQEAMFLRRSQSFDGGVPGSGPRPEAELGAVLLRGRGWPGAGRGTGNWRDGTGDGDGRMKGVEEKQHGAGPSRLPPALQHAVEEEGGCTSRTEEKYKQCL